jgi:hypothetical protein
MLRAPESAAADAYRMVLRSIPGVNGRGARGTYLVATINRNADGAVAVANLGIAAVASGARTIVIDPGSSCYRQDRPPGPRRTFSHRRFSARFCAGAVPKRT